MEKKAKDAPKNKSSENGIDELPIEEWAYLEKLVEHVDGRHTDETTQNIAHEKKTHSAPEKKQVPAAVQHAILPHYRPQEFYTKQEGQKPAEENKGEQKAGSSSANKEIILEWEQGLKDEDAIYKNPVAKVQDFARDFNNPGKRFLDRRTQKYKPS